MITFCFVMGHGPSSPLKVCFDLLMSHCMTLSCLPSWLGEVSTHLTNYGVPLFSLPFWVIIGYLYFLTVHHLVIVMRFQPNWYAGPSY